MISNTFKMTATGTSFHGDTITASVNDLIQIVGEPVDDTNDGQDKVNFEWNLELEDGTVFTIYDWKEYRSLSRDEMIEWHIGGHSRISTIKACDELQQLLRNI